MNEERVPRRNNYLWLTLQKNHKKKQNF